jgi:hypothetical protein
VTIRKISRDPEGIESLKLYALLTPQDALGVGIHDQVRLDEFVERVKRGLGGSLQKASRLHGLRVEALFRAMLVARADERAAFDDLINRTNKALK